MLLIFSCTTGPVFRPLKIKKLRVFVIDSGVNSEIPEIKPYLRFYDPVAIKDENDHGSHIAGIIAKAACPGVEIIPCKGAFDYRKSNECLQHALNLKVNIINYSMGGDFPEEQEFQLFKALETAGIIVNAAAGNSGRALFVKSYYPASYNFANINIVGALNSSGTRAIFSNYTGYMVWEPGINIISFNRFGALVPFSGTSQATALHTARMVKEWCEK